MPDHSFDILLLPFLTGLLVLATHVPLGRLVLERGIVFIDLAVAQVAGLGVVAAGFFGPEPDGWTVQTSAVAAALASAAFLIWTEKRFAEVQEAVIGIVFVAAASAQIILLSFSAHGAEHLKDLLVGQILWVVPAQIYTVGALYAAIVAIIIVFPLREKRPLFYAVFAVTVTASVQLVGIFLVFASLIIPALAARGQRLTVGYGVGLAGYGLGLLASVIWDFPTGAAVVCGLALACILWFLRPRGGEYTP